VKKCGVIAKGAIAMLFCFNVKLAFASSELSNEEILNIATVMKTMAGRIANLKFRSTCEVLPYNNEKKIWDKENAVFQATVDVWIKNAEGDMARLDVDEKIDSGKQGKKYTVSYDGHEGITVTHEIIKNGQVYAVKEATKKAEKPSFLESDRMRNMSGIEHTIYYQFKDQGYSFWQLLAFVDIPRNTLTKDFNISRAMLGDVNCIKIAANTKTKQNWWLDPAKGYSLVGYDYIVPKPDGQVFVVAAMRVKDFKLLDNGVWFPTHITNEYNPPILAQGQEVVRMKYIWKIISVENSFQNFDEDFKNAIPAGYRIKE
jgi:hypothetical protein